MSNRLSKIYTRGGDKGKTSLANGNRVSKYSPRIEALGTVDELNSLIGLVLSDFAESSHLSATLSTIQHQLFDLGGELAVADPSYIVIETEEIEFLENSLDQMNDELEPLAEFILPGGSTSVAQIHLARTVCRRAERAIIRVQDEPSEQVNQNAVIYLNRLSDLLFVASRYLAKQLNEPEILWQPKAKRK